jgi:hypothetical protein
MVGVGDFTAVATLKEKSWCGFFFFFKQLTTFFEPIKSLTMFAIYFIQAVTSRKKDLIDELDGLMIIKFGEGLTQRSVNALCSMSEESIEDIISQAKRHDVVGLIIEED